MSTLHFDHRIIPKGSSCLHESLTDKRGPYVYVYHGEPQLKRDILSSHEFQTLFRTVLDGIGTAFFEFLERKSEIFEGKDEKIVLDVSQNVMDTAKGELERLKSNREGELEADKFLELREKRLKMGRDFLVSYFGKEVIFRTSYGLDEIKVWRQNHLQTIFGVAPSHDETTFYDYLREVNRNLQSENRVRLEQWKAYVEKEKFHVVQHPDIGDVVWYLEGKGTDKSVVVEPGLVETGDKTHELFEIGKKVIFLRKRAD